ncbi:hypothetical protein BDZ89DRAFT_1068992 [Hymenopellis radicata]|nr:hypothetical protein BDZ89DRAFT_1068992 [Hymenopellis radicata]
MHSTTSVCAYCVTVDVSRRRRRQTSYDTSTSRNCDIDNQASIICGLKEKAC